MIACGYVADCKIADWNFNTMNRLSAVLALLLSTIAIHACSTNPSRSGRSNPVVGTWIVNDADAPFPYHMYVFNEDGTLQQASPDAFAGTATARSYEAGGILTDAPTLPGRFEGKRVTYP